MFAICFAVVAYVVVVAFTNVFAEPDQPDQKEFPEVLAGEYKYATVVVTPLAVDVDDVFAVEPDGAAIITVLE